MNVPPDVRHVFHISADTTGTKEGFCSQLVPRRSASLLRNVSYIADRKVVVRTVRDLSLAGTSRITSLFWAVNFLSPRPTLIAVYCMDGKRLSGSTQLKLSN